MVCIRVPPTCPNGVHGLDIRVIHSWRWVFLAYFLGCLSSSFVFGQIDPVKRELIQVGYNAALQGHPPQSGYAFYYLNKPEAFSTTNITLRMAVAPTYLDSEVGFSGLLGPNTDVGIGLAGGGFADNYPEVRRGTFLPDESFIGYGGELSASIYHLFNPGKQIPLYGVLRGIAHYSVYDKDSDTAKDFELPNDHATYTVRTGLRWGGREPTLFPSLAMELSIWYQGEFRSESDNYGFLVDPNNPSGPHDRKLESYTHLFYAEAMLAYVMPESKHSWYVSLTAGTSINADRFSAYRLGALLPLVSEYPLSLPGYYYQEISARQFVLLSGNYIWPLDKKQRWNIDLNAATAVVDYLPGLEQPGNSHTGLGAGILYRASSFKVMVGYGYGVNALRSSGQGAHSVGILMQLDLGQAKETMFNPAEPSLWRGLQSIFGLFGN